MRRNFSIGNCADVQFDILLHTNTAKDHNRHYGKLHDQFCAELSLFRSLTKPNKDTAVINIDDPYANALIEAADKVPIVTYSLQKEDADLYIIKLELSIFDSIILINTPSNAQLKIITPLIGKANAYNIVAAAATAIAAKIPLEAIVSGIQSVELVPGRYEAVDEGQEFAVLIDAAHTPAGLSNLLDALRDCKPSRIIAVHGCNGDQDKEARPFIGEILHFKADIVILTNNNPRNESPDRIINEIVAGWPDNLLLKHRWFLYPWYQDIGRLPLWYTDQALWAQSKAKRYIIEDRNLAIRSALYTAQSNDIVVICGKGDENYQEWAGFHLYSVEDSEVKIQPEILKKIIKCWFEDRAECRDAISKLPEVHAILSGMNRAVLPWTWPGFNRKHPFEEWDCNRISKEA